MQKGRLFGQKTFIILFVRCDKPDRFGPHATKDKSGGLSLPLHFADYPRLVIYWAAATFNGLPIYG